MSPHPRSWRVDLDQELANAYAAKLKRFGMNQKVGTVRLMRTFLSFEPDLQALMLELLTPDRTAVLARAILRELGRRRTT